MLKHRHAMQHTASMEDCSWRNRQVRQNRGDFMTSPVACLFETQTI
jgi:hypothetical protein